MIVVLAGRGRSTRIVVNHLANEFQVTLIEEKSIRAWQVLKRRARKVGWTVVIGQLLFMLYAKAQGRLYASRVHEIESQAGLDSRVPSVTTHHVPSANADETVELLRKLSPEVVVVNGTRILSKQVLESLPVPFINTHAGISPKYRGVHGAYWALACSDAQNAGVTVHVVDQGIDTGAVLYQARITPGSNDSFSTYPTLQLAAALPLLKQAVQDAINGELRIVPMNGESKLFHHPTIWAYVEGLLRGVR